MLFKAYNYILFVCVFCCSLIVNSQNILVDNSFTAQQLIENNFVEGCVEVSNVTSNINGSVNGFNSFAYFERDLSNFPFENGIMLSTGDAISGGNAINTNLLNDGETSWGTDPDLETALGITNTLNATTIEFDFISISNLIQFNYILASEEYFANFPCDYSDGFAFLIREAGTTDPYTNIALIPGTTIPVNTNTIHDEIVGFCAAENEAYFDGYTMGDTNYNGRTTVLTASANIIPNIQYHIKLVIADQTDENYDSTVFIQGNSFNPTVDLGSDVTTCADEYTIDGDIQNPLATYSWYRDGVLIPSETNPTLLVTQTGTYRVEISIPLNSINCVIEDDIVVALNSVQNANPLTDYELCDDLSRDGIELFDLTIKDTEAEAAVSSGNYSISYHYSLTDAENNINAITSSISNTSNPQTIFVRIIDIDTGCLAYTSFNLIVYELPNIIEPTPIELCDDTIADGSTIFDLTLTDSEITQGDASLIVTYHFTQIDADAGINAIPQPYVNTNPNETLYVRVINPNTGCVSTTTISLTVLVSPVVDPGNAPPLNACVDDGSGFGTFDLTEILPDLLAGLTGVTVTFHETVVDAETGDNPIADETNYQNIVQDMQTVYVRIVDNVTGCATVVPIEIHANVLITGTNIRDFFVCDDSSSDGIADFNLEDIALSIINNLVGVTITFYESQDDLDNDINAIDQATPYEVTSSPHTIYMKAETSDCVYEATINLIINPPVVLTPITAIDYCDTDDDGFVAIDVTSLDGFISTDPNSILTYYTTEIDAIDSTNALPGLYTNTTNPQTLYVRAQFITTSCFDTMPIEINVIPAPTVTQPDDVIICDDNQDALSIIDLDAMIPQFIADTTDITISFHNSLDDANNDVNPIATSSNYNATNETVFVRAESDITGCHAVVEINIIVNTLPDFIPISNYENCETDGNQIADFLFSTKDSEILNGQSGKQVLYFETATDAANRTNIIDKNTIYANTSSPQTIHVRVENITDQDCFGVSSFDLEVGSIPLFNPPTNYIVCDDISNDGFELFNLQDKIDEISLGISETLVITFHTTFNDAENELNPIALNYTNTINPQQIYVRVDNGTYCHEIAEFGLNVIQVPTVNLPSAIELCDADYDESTTFDLTVSEFEILDVRDDDIVISYFENEADLEADTNQITNPDSYENITNPQTVYVKVTNTISNCFVSFPLDLIVNLPPTINAIPSIETCDSPTNTYDLLEATSLFFDDTTGTIISYHLSNNDAINNQNALATTYNYTAPTTTIYIRAEYVATGCTAISLFDLIVYPNPIVNTPPSLEECDDDYDFELIFDISQQTPIVLGPQSPAQFTVTYYETDVDAIDGTNAISDLNYNAIDGQIIYVRIENNATGCFDTTLFQTIVQRKPLVEIPEQVICLDNLPLTVFAGELVPGDSYVWNTGETTSEIEIDDIGEYSVTVTTPLGCETTTLFNVIESEPATIDFSDPNNITVTISGIGNYLYQLDDNQPQTSNVFTNVSLGYHTVTVIDLNGCDSTTREVIVIDAPKFMTPNADGYFDTWHISGVETLAGTTIYIYDRYGKQMTYLTATSEGWNGTYNGQKMPANDYWFVADVVKGDLSFQVKGHFALRR